MNQASFFIEKKALFGGFPNHQQIIELQKLGVTTFIDLTFGMEKNTFSYSNVVDNWINYPIKDGHVPQNNKHFLIFLLLIQMIVESLQPEEKIYIHCKGGHGRSTLVVSCFLGMVFKLPSEESLKLARMYHNVRPNLSPKWFITEWPLNAKQRKFVESFFGQLYLHSDTGQWLAFLKDREKDLPKILRRNSDVFRYFILVNFQLHQNPILLHILLNSGCKTILGEGILSTVLQELRGFILQHTAKKIFTEIKLPYHLLEIK